MTVYSKMHEDTMHPRLCNVANIIHMHMYSDFQGIIH